MNEVREKIAKELYALSRSKKEVDCMSIASSAFEEGLLWFGDVMDGMNWWQKILFYIVFGSLAFIMLVSLSFLVEVLKIWDRLRTGKVLAKIKYILWYLNIYPNKCPYCGDLLLEHGFEGVNQRWTCPDRECEFNQ